MSQSARQGRYLCWHRNDLIIGFGIPTGSEFTAPCTVPATIENLKLIINHHTQGGFTISRSMHDILYDTFSAFKIILLATLQG